MAYTDAFDQYNPSIMISTPASYPEQGHRPIDLFKYTPQSGR
jgi:hypothetical protein